MDELLSYNLATYVNGERIELGTIRTWDPQNASLVAYVSYLQMRLRHADSHKLGAYDHYFQPGYYIQVEVSCCKGNCTNKFCYDTEYKTFHSDVAKESKFSATSSILDGTVIHEVDLINNSPNFFDKNIMKVLSKEICTKPCWKIPDNGNRTEYNVKFTTEYDDGFWYDDGAQNH
jgi:hypothetical protein